MNRKKKSIISFFLYFAFNSLPPLQKSKSFYKRTYKKEIYSLSCVIKSLPIRIILETGRLAFPRFDMDGKQGKGYENRTLLLVSSWRCRYSPFKADTCSMVEREGNGATRAKRKGDEEGEERRREFYWQGVSVIETLLRGNVCFQRRGCTGRGCLSSCWERATARSVRRSSTPITIFAPRSSPQLLICWPWWVIYQFLLLWNFDPL